MKSIQDELLEVLNRHREQTSVSRPAIPQWEDAQPEDLTNEPDPATLEE